MPTKTNKKSAELEALLEKRNQMLQAKVDSGDKWTPEQQKDLDGLTEALILLGYKEETEQPTDSQPETEQPKPTPKRGEKAPAKGFEPSDRDKRKVFLKIRRGTKFDPNTGKPIGKPYVQAFNYGEWVNFAKNYDKLGFTVMEVLYDPYGEAEKMFNKH